eukprot:g41517.t1
MIDEGSAMNGICVEFSKAFDKVHYDRLIQKMKSYGIHWAQSIKIVKSCSNCVKLKLGHIWNIPCSSVSPYLLPRTFAYPHSVEKCIVLPGVTLRTTSQLQKNSKVVQT